MTALVLAAGYSRRAKTCKYLLPLGSATVIEQTIATFHSTCRRIVVVGGHNIEDLEQHLGRSEYLKRLALDITLVYNRDYPSGMFSSVQLGAAEVGDGSFFVTPADIPGVRRSTIHSLHTAEGDVVLPCVNRRSGHPVKCSSRVRQSILRARRESTLRDVLNAYEKQYVPLADEAVLIDLDTREDYKRIQSFFDESVKEQ